MVLALNRVLDLTLHVLMRLKQVQELEVVHQEQNSMSCIWPPTQSKIPTVRVYGVLYLYLLAFSGRD